MALRTGSDLIGWESIFTNAGITMTSAKVYAQTFSSEGITRDSMHMLDRKMLKELGIKSMGDVLIILKLAKENPATLNRCQLYYIIKLPELIFFYKSFKIKL